MRNRKVVSRSALGRSERRATSSTVGRVCGCGTGDVARRVAQRPGHERPRGARALRTDRGARAASSSGERSPALTATSAITSQRPRCRSAPRSTLSAGPTTAGIGALRASGTKNSTHREIRWLSLIIGARPARCAPFDSRRATRAISAAKATCDWRLAATLASGAASAGSREKHAADSAAVPPASSAASASLRSVVELAVLRLRERADARRVDFAIERLAPDHHAHGLGHRGSQCGAQRRDGSKRAGELRLARGPSLEDGVELGLEACTRRLVDDLRTRESTAPASVPAAATFSFPASVPMRSIACSPTQRPYQIEGALVRAIGHVTKAKRVAARSSRRARIRGVL